MPGCGRVAILAEPSKRFIAEAVLYRLDTPELAAALAGAALPDDDGEQANLAADRAQLEELARAYGERQITFPEYLAARKPIEARIEAGPAPLSRSTRTEAIDAYVGEVRRAPGDLGRSAARPVSGRSSPRCSTGPSSGPAVRGRNRFDPDRVEPVWRV